MINDNEWDVWVSEGVLVEVLRGEHVSVAQQFGVEWDGPTSSAMHRAVFDDPSATATTVAAGRCECSLWSLCVRALAGFGLGSRASSSQEGGLNAFAFRSGPPYGVVPPRVTASAAGGLVPNFFDGLRFGFSEGRTCF